MRADFIKEQLGHLGEVSLIVIESRLGANHHIRPVLHRRQDGGNAALMLDIGIVAEHQVTACSDIDHNFVLYGSHLNI